MSKLIPTALLRLMAASGLVLFALQQGVNKQTRIARQTAKGSIASVGGGQVLRRTSSTFELQKDVFDTSAEITSTQQLKNVQHGVKAVKGQINGLFSPGTYSDPMSALLRRDFAAVTPSATLGITISGSGPTYTVARGSGSWLTDGYKVGMVGRLSVGALNAANISKNLAITAVTASNLTVMPLNGSALVAEGPITGCTFTAIGKVTFAPPSGQTKIYYTIEEWNADVPSSEVYQDNRCGTAQITLPGTGNSTIQLGFDGLDAQTPSGSVYFTTPTAESSANVVSAPAGILLVNGVAQAIITNATVNISANQSLADGVVGSLVRPDVFQGKVMAEGQISAYFDSTTIPLLFSNATDFAIVLFLPNGSGAAADFVSICLPLAKLTSNTPDDNEKGLKRTYNYKAQYNAAGGSGVQTEQTSIQVQDSLA